ncbi:MAG: response regulator [Thiomargarita sp.]|nr:response regulator [Thiomargarita sp.]
MNILIIDDSRVQRTLIASYVRKFDPTGNIFESATPSDAYAKLRGHPIDLITLDYHLTDTDVTGFDLLETIRELHLNVRIIMITSDLKPQVKEKAIQRGLELIFKPLSIQKIKSFFI